MKVDGNPFLINMIEGSTTLIKKYQKKREREGRADRGIWLDPIGIVTSSSTAGKRA
jgi:hypothetical protein